MSKTGFQLLAFFVGVAGVSTAQGAPPPNHNNNTAPNHNNMAPTHEHHNGFGGAVSFFSAAKQFAVHHFEEWKANQHNRVEEPKANPNNRVEEWKANPNNHANTFSGPRTYKFGEPNPEKTNSATTGMTNPATQGKTLTNLGSTTGSKHPGANSGTTNHSQNNAVTTSEEHIERAMHYLSEARSALRAGHDISAEHEIHEAIRQLEQAVEHQHGHSANNGSSGIAVASLSTSKLGASSKLTASPASSTPTSSTQNSRSNVGSEGHHEHPHIYDAVRHLHEAQRQIKEGHSGRAELDIHDAFVQMTEALRDRRR